MNTASLFGLLLAVFVLAAPSASFAQPNIGATLDDGVPAGTYKQNGDTLNYTIVITNSGAGDATGVTLTDPTPANTVFVPGSLHASPLAFADTYNATGNTKLYVGTTPPAGEPAMVVAGPTLLANDTISTSPDTIILTAETKATTQGGSVTINGTGTFTYTPPVGFTGNDTFTYTIRNSADASLADTGTVTVAVSNVVWYVNNSGANGNGTSASPFNSLAGVNGAGGAGDSDAANAFIYVYRGTGAAYIGGLPLESGQTLTSENVALVVGGNTLRAATGLVPTLSHNTGSTVALSTNNTINSFIISNSNGNGISGSAIGTAAISNIAVTVTGGTALNATTSGTLTVTGTANTLNSTNNTALNVANVTIGAGGLTFLSISSGAGANNGINLDTTGSSGGLTVTGSGTAGSGGTIQHKTGADGLTSGNGIYLNNTAKVSLSRMQLNDFDNSAIRGLSVTGFTLTNSVISGIVGNNTAVTEGAITFGTSNPSGANGLFGTGAQASLIDNVNVSGAIEHIIEVYNQSGSFGLTISNSNIHDNSAAGGSDGIQMEMQGTATATVNITNNSFSNNKSQGIQLAANDDSTINATISKNTITRGTQGNEGIVLSNGSNGKLITLVGGPNPADGNTISDFGGVGIFVGQTPGNANALAGGATGLQATIQNNTVTSPASATNTSIIAFLTSTLGQVSQARILIDGNTVTQNSTGGTSRAILVDTPDTDRSPNFDVTVTDNTAHVTDNVAGALPIAVNARKAATGHFDIRGNAADFPNGNPGVNGVRARQADTATAQLFGSGASAASVLAANNPGATTEVLGTVTLTSTAVLLPATPPLPLLSAPGGVEAAEPQFAGSGDFNGDGSSDVLSPRQDGIEKPAGDSPSAPRPVQTHLTQSELDAIVSAALARWTATGLTAEQIARLRALRFEVAGLGDLHLGEASGNLIRVDRKAAGNGWFIDPTPMDDAEFASAAAGARRYTDPAGAPAGRIDLLTTVMHEMGHRLGLADAYGPGDRDGVMYGYLTKGERRLPTARDAAAARVSGPLQARSHYLDAPLNIGTLPAGKSVTVKHSVTIASPTATTISNQGTVSGTNFSNVLTDDPTVGGAANATVTDVAVPPIVTTHPDNQTTDVGLSNATFTAAASSNPAATVQWFVQTGGAGPFDPVPGGTNTTLTITNAQLAQNGNVYHAVFTNDKTVPTSTATTNNATLTVNPALSIAPAALAAATAGTATNQTITVSDGTKPYTTFEVINFVAGGTGLTAANLTPDASAGTVVLSGTPTAAGTASFTVHVVDTPGGTLSKNYTLTVNAALSIAPAALAAATAGTAANQTITVSGGTTPYTTFEVANFVAGGTGLTAANLTANAGAGTVVLNGTPTAAGTASFTVNVTDTAGATLSKNYSLTVNPALSIAPAALAQATAGTATNQTITVSDGTKPYTTFEVINFVAGGTGLTQANLTLDAAAGTVVLSGTPTAAGTATFTVHVIDTAGATLSKNYTLTVVNGPLVIAPAALTGATVGTAINQTITVSQGVKPYTTFEVTSFSAGGTGLTQGANLTLDAAAGTVVLSGTPTAAGTASFTVNVTDTANDTLTKNYTLTVNPALSIAPAALVEAIVGKATNQTITVSNGTTPYTNLSISGFSAGTTGLTAGNLTTDASAGTAVLSATPTAAGTATFTVNVTDTAGATLTKNYTLTVNPLSLIHDVQGNGAATPVPGTTVAVEGVVVGDFQGAGQLQGFFVQEEDADVDADPNTSEGIFVACGACSTAVVEGDKVQVTGIVSEIADMTTITASSVVVSSTGNPLPSSTTVDLPVTAPDLNAFYEAREGMRVTFVDTLTVADSDLQTFGHILLFEGTRPLQFTEANPPNAAGYAAHLDNLARRGVILDDDNNVANAYLAQPDGMQAVYHPRANGGFSVGTQGTDFFRNGDIVNGLTGVLHWSSPGSGAAAWRIRPTAAPPATFTVANPRPATPPAVGGTIKAASVDLSNYFTTLDVRGADSTAELNRQRERLSIVLCALNAHVAGLTEVENGTAAITDLLGDVNARCGGASPYAFATTGGSTLGADAIRNAIIYRTTILAPVGAALNDLDPVHNRPPTAQTFDVIAPTNPAFGQRFTAVVNHSKSRDCTGASGADLDQADGQACFAATRTAQSTRLLTWINATVIPAAGDPDVLLLGNFSSYAQETPTTTITAGGYTDLHAALGGSSAYSEVFTGEIGNVGHVFAGSSFNSKITGAGAWHISADESSLFDYNDEIKDGAAEAASEEKPDGSALAPPRVVFQAASPYRAGEHDPLLVGLFQAADLAVSMTDSPDPVTAGQNLTYTITVSNNGPDAAASASWSDTLPAGTSFVSLPTVAGWSCTTGGTVSCSNPSFAVGSAVFTLTVAVAPTAAGALSNTATATSATAEGSPGNESATELTTVTALPKENTATSVSSSLNPSTFGQSVTFTATVTPQNVGNPFGTPTGTVTFTIDGVAQSPVALAGNQASFTTSALSGGNHPVSATYNGDTFFNTSSGTLAGGQTVNKVATTTTVATSKSPSVFGESVTFTATVSGSGATGTVTFKDGAASIGSGTLSGGTATFATTSLSVGPHTITAVYAGNTGFAGSTSPGITQTVDKAATTTSVSAAPNLSKPGEPVEFTATVAVTAPATITPTGTVTFKQGATTLGTGTLTSGKASFTTTDLTIGSHTVTASYDGTTAFETSTGTVTATVDPRVGPQFSLNTFTAGTQHEPSVARLSNDGFVVAWASNQQDGSGYGVYGQRYNAAGGKAGGEFRVSTRRANDQSRPSVAGLTNGFVVLWQSAGQDGTGIGVYGQRYNAAGGKAGGEFRVNSITEKGFLPSVAGLSGGGFIATWTSQSQDGSLSGIYAQRYKADGTAAGSEFRVNSTTKNRQTLPSVAGLTGGGFIVTWQSKLQDGSGFGIYAQRFAAGGGKVGGEFRVNTAKVKDQLQPSVTAGLSDGGFVIAWQSDRQDGAGFGIYGQRYAKTGAKIGGEFRVNTTTAMNQARPSVAAFQDGGFVVAWVSRDQTDRGIFAQVYDAQGHRLDKEFPVNTTTLGTQSQPSAAAFSDGNFVIVWTSQNQDGSLEGVYGQRFRFLEP